MANNSEGDRPGDVAPPGCARTALTVKGVTSRGFQLEWTVGGAACKRAVLPILVLTALAIRAWGSCALATGVASRGYGCVIVVGVVIWLPPTHANPTLARCVGSILQNNDRVVIAPIDPPVPPEIRYHLRSSGRTCAADTI